MRLLSPAAKPAEQGQDWWALVHRVRDRGPMARQLDCLQYDTPAPRLEHAWVRELLACNVVVPETDDDGASEAQGVALLQQLAAEEPEAAWAYLMDIFQRFSSLVRGGDGTLFGQALARAQAACPEGVVHHRDALERQIGGNTEVCLQSSLALVRGMGLLSPTESGAELASRLLSHFEGHGGVRQTVLSCAMAQAPDLVDDDRFRPELVRLAEYDRTHAVAEALLPNLGKYPRAARSLLDGWARTPHWAALFSCLPVGPGVVSPYTAAELGAFMEHSDPAVRARALLLTGADQATTPRRRGR